MVYYSTSLLLSLLCFTNTSFAQIKAGDGAPFHDKIMGAYVGGDDAPATHVGLTNLMKLYVDLDIVKIIKPGHPYYWVALHKGNRSSLPENAPHDHQEHDHKDHDHKVHEHKAHAEDGHKHALLDKYASHLIQTQQHESRETHYEDSPMHFLQKRKLAPTWSCIAPSYLISSYNTTSLSPSNMFDSYPLLVHMLLTYACRDSFLLPDGGIFTQVDATPPPIVKKEEKLPALMVWIYATAAVTLITLCAMIGILFVPMLYKTAIVGDLAMTFFMALAVGVLVSDAVLHILPELFMGDHKHDHMHDHAVGSSVDSGAVGEGVHDHSGTVWLSSVVMGGIYFFWLFEKFLHYRFKGKGNAGGHSHGHSHSHSHSHGTPMPTIQEKTPELSTQNEPQIKPVAYLIIFGDSFHNFVDGLTIGASFAASLKLGLTTSLAVLFVNFFIFYLLIIIY